MMDAMRLDPGCYIGGHWGQYGIDRLAVLFGTEAQHAEMVRLRAEMESDGYDPMVSDAFEGRAEIADEIVDLLNAVLPSRLYAHWYEGEFFISPARECDDCDCSDPTAPAWLASECECDCHDN